MDAPLVFDAVPVPTAAGAPLAVELVPAPDPWAVARRLAPLPHLLFLDSAEHHPDRGRYSYVSADPTDLHVWSVAEGVNPLAGDRRDRRPVARPAGVDLPPFMGGQAGVFGYGLGRAFD